MRPIYFVGQIAYYELNIDYIIETYCVNKDKPQLQCNGKCHLAKQLQLTETNTNTDENPATNAVVEAFYPLYFQTINYDVDGFVVGTFPKKKWFCNTIQPVNFIDDLYHPPRVISSISG